MCFAIKGAGELALERKYNLENEGKQKRREPAETGKGTEEDQSIKNSRESQTGEAEGSWVTMAAFQLPH